MKFFNIDQHVSVIADIAHIFKNLGHQVDDWSLSGHHWVLGKPKPKIMLSDGSQLIGSNVCTQETCDKFYEQYKDQLEQYDAFIVCYPVEFALLYEKWNKPIIVVNCVRYEADMNIQTWTRIIKSRLDNFLKLKQSEGKLYYICNNKGDQYYTKYFTGIDGVHIPSLCEYTNAKYTGTKNKYIIHDRAEISVNNNLCINLDNIRDKNRKYTWQDLYDYKGVIHVPYNNGSMSIFEQYTANVPMFFPSKQYAKKLISENKMFSDLTFYKINKVNEPEDYNNPNSLRNPEILNKWIDTSDMYDVDNMKYIQYFDSLAHLEHLLKTVNLKEISSNMSAHNVLRKESIYNSWNQIITSVKSKIN